jgi:hypothetical protein
MTGPANAASNSKKHTSRAIVSDLEKSFTNLIVDNGVDYGKYTFPALPVAHKLCIPTLNYSVYIKSADGNAGYVSGKKYCTKVPSGQSVQVTMGHRKATSEDWPIKRYGTAKFKLASPSKVANPNGDDPFHNGGKVDAKQLFYVEYDWANNTKGDGFDVPRPEPSGLKSDSDGAVQQFVEGCGVATTAAQGVIWATVDSGIGAVLAAAGSCGIGGFEAVILHRNSQSEQQQEAIELLKGIGEALG